MLSCLAKTKSFLSFFLFLLSISLVAYGNEQPMPDHFKWGRILKRYVAEGLVDYQHLLESKAELNSYLMELGTVPIETLSEMSREDRIAFWINLFNASVIKLVLDEYPIERFGQIPAAFEIRTARAAGEFFSLSEIRDQILRQGFKDERVLFALVSGRLDSPKLLAEAFSGEKLEQQLDQVARDFVEDETYNKIKPGEKKVYLSPLFRDFGKDFLLNFGSVDSSSSFSEIETAIISFLLHHLRSPEKRLFLDSGRYKIVYLAEDPRLNDTQDNVRKEIAAGGRHLE